MKFQKRTVDVVYTKEELARPRENPFGTTNGDLKRGLEFGEKEYREIDAHCKEKGIQWFASCWDEGAVDFMEEFNPPCYKIASASLTDDKLLQYHRSKKRPILLSTGMSSLEEMDHAVEVLGKEDLVVLHCTSTYPSKIEELNLSAITTFMERYGVPIGYSGHEVGLAHELCCRRPRRLHRGTPHHPRPRDVGLRTRLLPWNRRVSCASCAISACGKRPVETV